MTKNGFVKYSITMNSEFYSPLFYDSKQQVPGDLLLSYIEMPVFKSTRNGNLHQNNFKKKTV